MAGRVSFATRTAPRPPLTELVSNPTPPGQIARERVSLVDDQPGRESSVNLKMPSPCCPPIRLTRNQFYSINQFTELDAVAFLTRLAGMFSVKDPKENAPGLTWTALDVGGP